jgi:hypothetical protein
MVWDEKGVSEIRPVSFMISTRGEVRLEPQNAVPFSIIHALDTLTNNK